MRAGIALGSNLGERLEHLQSAFGQIRKMPGVRSPFMKSSAYETAPVGCEVGTPSFLNAVVEVEFYGSPAELLHGLRAIESNLGRPADHPRNASRTIDLDLLYLGDATVSTPELALPHPRMPERRFVLEPLAEIRPDLTLPGQTEAVATLVGRLPYGPPLLRVATEW